MRTNDGPQLKTMRADRAPDRQSSLQIALAALRKLREHRQALAGVLTDAMALARLVAAWGRREYVAVPWRTIAMAVGALVYFLNPLDLVPDFLPTVGYLDDATMIALVARTLRGDLERFRRWEEERHLRAQGANEWARSQR